MLKKIKSQIHNHESSRGLAEFDGVTLGQLLEMIVQDAGQTLAFSLVSGVVGLLSLVHVQPPPDFFYLPSAVHERDK